MSASVCYYRVSLKNFAARHTRFDSSKSSDWIVFFYFMHIHFLKQVVYIAVARGITEQVACLVSSEKWSLFTTLTLA